MVDVVILFVYTLVEGMRGNLEPNRTVHAEHPSDKMGVGTCILYSYLALINVIHLYAHGLPTIYVTAHADSLLLYLSTGRRETTYK